MGPGALAGWFSGLERCPIHQKVAGSIPGWGNYGKQVIVQSSGEDFFFSFKKTIIGPWLVWLSGLSSL